MKQDNNRNGQNTQKVTSITQETDDSSMDQIMEGGVWGQKEMDVNKICKVNFQDLVRGWTWNKEREMQNHH